MRSTSRGTGIDCFSSDDWVPIRICGYAGNLMWAKPPRTGVTTSQPIDRPDDLRSSSSYSLFEPLRLRRVFDSLRPLLSPLFNKFSKRFLDSFKLFVVVVSSSWISLNSRKVFLLSNPVSYFDICRSFRLLISSQCNPLQSRTYPHSISISVIPWLLECLLTSS